MPLLFLRKRSPEAAAQRSLFDPTVVGRSFERAACRPIGGEELLPQRLAELDLKRRRAQIRARRAVDAPEPRLAELPFAERAASERAAS